MMDSNLRFIYFCIILFILLISVSCSIESKIRSDLKKISRDLKSQKLCDKTLKNLGKIPSLSGSILPNLEIKLYKLDAKLKKPFKKLKAHSKLNLPKSPLMPKLPGLPLLPAIPLLPLPLMPPLPLIPPPLLSLPLPLLHAPKLLKPLPFRLKKLKDKIDLQKALGSEIKPIWVPAEKKKKGALDKLKKLKKGGSLTNKEYLKFKKLLKL